MSDFCIDTVVIGAGVVGLAIAKELSKQNLEVLVVEAEEDFGQITSSRNSGVIHAGIYYPENSLKSKFCVLGNRLLYDYCKKNFIPYLNTKKLLVASSFDQIKIIDQINNRILSNPHIIGVDSEGYDFLIKKECFRTEFEIEVKDAETAKIEIMKIIKNKEIT